MRQNNAKTKGPHSLRVSGLIVLSVVALVWVFWEARSIRSIEIKGDKSTEKKPGSPPQPKQNVETEGQHICTCLPDEEDTSLIQVPNFRWLHIPKTGTSFIITLWLYATSETRPGHPKRTIDTNVSTYHREVCKDCYDYALMQRYPLEMYAFSKNNGPNKKRTFASIHVSHEPHGALREVQWDTTQELVFLREPHARAVSAFDNDMHSYGNFGEHTMIKKKCAGDVNCYANRPGQMGCMLRMLTGATCSVPSNSPHQFLLSRVNDQDVQARLARGKKLLSEVGFLGLTEEWNESLCRFHQKFGGKPLPSQFQNVRKGSKKTSVADLSPTYKDPLDEELYTFAVEEFKKRQTDNKECYQYLEPGSKAIQPQCVPKTCQELNKQCGEWPDGCGGVRICGICSLEGRDGLPESWRYQCSDKGQCVRTCPPWEKAELWFRPVTGDATAEANLWRSKLYGAPQEFVEQATSNGAEYLTPTDAVRMCVGACANKSSAFENVFASTYCKCGSDPTDFLEISPTLEDYRDLYNLKPAGKLGASKARNAKLKGTQTQPICCPPKEKGNPPSPWQPGIAIADYFQSFSLGCGGSDKCKQLGLEHNATVVTWVPVTSYCHLATNFGKTPKDVLEDKKGQFHLTLD